MTPAARRIVLDNLQFSPYRLPNIAARYSLDGPAGDSTYIVGGGTLALRADRSGNSGVNGLVLNGVAGNSASSPDSVPLSISGSIDLRCDVAMNDWTPGATRGLVCKFFNTGNQMGYQMLLLTDGTLYLDLSFNGSAHAVEKASTTATGFADFSRHWVRATWNSVTGDVMFYTSEDGVTWTQLGTTVPSVGGSIFNSTALIYCGASQAGASVNADGIFYRAQVYDGIGGTLVWDPNFTLQSKLDSSFPESSANGATVTINTTGDLGARICGARDRVNSTATEQAAFSTLNGYNIATYDGSDDYDKSAPYSGAQPRTRITVAKAVTWTSGDVLWDGNTAGAAKLSQTGTTPNVQLNAGSAGPQLATYVLDTVAVFVETINGASSTLQRNLDSATAAANAGAGAANATTMGADGAGANPANIVELERIEFSVVLTASTIARIVQFYARKYSGVLSLP